MTKKITYFVAYTQKSPHGVVLVAGDFPKTKKAALKESIRKWEFIVDYHKKNPHRGQPLDARDSSCALCKLFAEDHTCRGCPVANAAMNYSCRGTPWVNYQWADTPTKCLNAAIRELNFLKSLLAKM